MSEQRFDVEFILYDSQPMEAVSMALDQFASAGVEAVTLTYLVWEGSMSHILDVSKLADPQSKGHPDPVVCHIRAVVSAISSRGMRPGLIMPILQYPDSLLKEHPEWLGEGIAAGPGSEFDRSYDNRRERPICPAVEAFWPWFEDQCRCLFEALPELDRLTVMPSEGRCDLWACRCERCANITNPERLLTAVEHLHNAVCTRGQKELEVRTYLSGWRLSRQPQWWMPLQGRLPEDMILAFRGQFGDDHYLNPHHPFVEQFEHPRKALVIDLYNEKRGYTEFPCTIVEWLKERITHADAHGIKHFVGRLDTATVHPRTGRFVHLNFAAAAELAHDPEKAVETLYQGWAEERFGRKAGPAIVSVVKGCSEIINGAMFVNGLAITSHSYIPESLRRMQYIMTDYCGRCNPDAVSRLDGMVENIPALLEEKDKAIARCNEKLRLLDELANELELEDVENLRGQFSRLLAFTRILRELTAILFGVRRRERAWSILDREVSRQALIKTIQRCREAAQSVTVLRAEHALTICDEAEELLKETEVYDLKRSPLFNGFDPANSSLQEHLSYLEELGLWKRAGGDVPPGDCQ
jgi:hypothetical protein